MEFGQIHHIEYYVDDLSRSNRFWDWFLPFLGYETHQRWDKGLSWKHKSGTYIVFVQIESQVGETENNRKGRGVNHIAFQGKDLVHFKSLCEELKRRSVKILDLEDRYVCFEDPNQFAVEVYVS